MGHFRAAVVCLATLLAATANAAAVTRGPYLQSVTPTDAIVAFRLDGACPAQVRYGEGDKLTHAASSAGSGTQHAVHLTGLAPGRTYAYSVEACGESTGATNLLVTAPVPGTRSVHFAAVGDFGTGGSNQVAVTNAIVKAPPELVLGLGDTAYSSGTDAEFQSNFFTPMKPLLARVPMFASLGNHEYVTAQGQPYLDNLYLPSNNPRGTERYYSFDWGHVHFVALDSSCAIGLASSDRCSLAEQKTWVESDLKTSTAPWKVVFFHHPPWSSGEHGSQMTMRREFTPIFETRGVDLVLTGHDHNYERTKPLKGEAVVSDSTPGAITYFVVGSGGATLRQFAGSTPSWTAMRSDQAIGYLDVKVEGGTLSARLVNPGGAVVDSYTKSKVLSAMPGGGSNGEPNGGPGGEPGGSGSGPGSTSPWPSPGDGPSGEGGTGPSCASVGGSSGMSLLVLIVGVTTGLKRRHRQGRSTGSGRTAEG
jgi:hypothetical protein